ncbi:helix-turn-helix domain-containing protein [uncultured Draconibacterium sp.]|uniref:helix-turn-helix domain-containing protein n=1 Tax=uncultured Draconibacterium sp. TaxID=1573823 RepID=UPI0029C80E25|nr:helix-turn-helix domain-containing protein [uncultured Draconibacterium sp.]
MEVLQLLASTGREMSGVEISKELNIEKTKVNRILKTLAYLGFAMVSSNRKYSLGPAIHVLSAQILYGSGLIRNAFKYLVELTELEVVVAMGVLWRDKVAYTYHWHPGILPTDGLGRTELFPATQSSIGIALLAEKEDEQIASIINFEKPIPGFETKNDFLEAIEEARTNGYGKAVFEKHSSIAFKLGNPAYAAVALAHIENKKPMSDYLKILQEKAALIEAVGPSY